MITAECYFELLGRAAEACRNEDSAGAIELLIAGGIPSAEAQKKVLEMMEALPAIQAHQKRERELFAWRNRAGGARCIVVTSNGATPKAARDEAQCLWENVVAKVLADLNYNSIFCEGIEPTPMALQAVGQADLLIFIVSNQARELDWLQSQAQTLGKPIVPLISKRRASRLGLPLVSKPIYYTCRQNSGSCEIEDSEALATGLTQRIIEPGQEEGGSRYDDTRKLYEKPLRVAGAQSVRETIYREKIRIMHQLCIRLEDARQRMASDYELARDPGSGTALAPFADILTESASVFQNEYQCLHKAMREAVAALPEAQQVESLAVCDQMLELLRHLSSFIDALRVAAESVRAPEGRFATIENLRDEIRACCRLIPDRLSLVKSAAPATNDFFGAMDVVIKQYGHTVKSALNEAGEDGSIGKVKNFCRALRSALLCWLGMDRRTPGGYDEIARQMRDYGDHLRARFEPEGIQNGAKEVWTAIDQHVRAFDERLALKGEDRARQDYDELVRFVEDGEQ